MNTWFRRTVGTVGIAGGMLLLGAGAAHADDTALAPGQLDDLFAPTGGPNNQSLQLQSHTDRISYASSASTSAASAASASSDAAVESGRMPGTLDGLPLSSLLPTDSLGLPRTTSSRLPNLPALPTDAVATNALPTAGHAPSLANTEDSLAALPLVGQLTSLSQLGLPGTDTLTGTSVADTSTAFPSLPRSKPSPRRAATESLPLVGNLPVVGSLPLLNGGGLPVHGTLKPVDDYGIPVGGGPATEDTDLPLVGGLPLGGSDVLRNDSVTGVPVIGGVGPTPGVSTTAVANRLVPTTGALPQAASQLPLVTESAAYAPKHASSYTGRHAQTEALPVVTGLPAVGGIAQGVLPMLSGIVG